MVVFAVFALTSGTSEAVLSVETSEFSVTVSDWSCPTVLSLT